MMDIVLIGYSGHSFVVTDILQLNGYNLNGYLDKNEKDINPFDLPYLGFEEDEKILKPLIGKNQFFISVGDNDLRKRLFKYFKKNNARFVNAIDPQSVVKNQVAINGVSIMVGPNVIVNPLAEIKDGVILNTGCIIEHECYIDTFAHIAPGAVLAGNVSVGTGSFVGANSTIKEGVKIGENSIIGAGSVVLHDIPKSETWAGNPAKKIG